MNLSEVQQDEVAAAKLKIIDWLKNYLADLTGIPFADIDIDSTFQRYGLDSYQGVVMSYDLGEWLGCELDTTDAFENPSIAALATFLANDPRVRANLARRS